MLHLLKPNKGARSRTRRVGRGPAAGGGTTTGRGTKGQHARTGKGYRFGFEGGQVPLIRRQPKMGGFTKPRRDNFEPVNIDTLEERLEAGSYDAKALRALKIVRTGARVKLLSRGTVTKKFALTVHAASEKAKQAVEKAGGSVTIIKD